MAMTVTELAEQVRDSNQRLAEAIHDLRGEMSGLRQEVAQSREEFKSFQVEVPEKLGAVNTKLENLGTRVEPGLSITRWAITVTIPIVLGAIVWSYTTLERLARLETSIATLRDTTEARGKQIDKIGGSVAKLETSIATLRDAAEPRGKQIDKIEASVMALRDTTQAQGKQIEAQGKQVEGPVRVVGAKPPIDPASIVELIEQGKHMREDLRQIKDAVSKSGAPSRPR
jgi:chromosome segregation ATPase